MSSTALKSNSLPPVRGRYTHNAPLGEMGWFKCGGVAEVLFKPADLEDLQNFLVSYIPSPSIPLPERERESERSEQGEGIHIFGALSNTIIRDGGLSGVTIRLGREFSGIEVDGECVKVGALALDANVAQVAAENGIGGLEFLSGIPGTIGGAIRMNAGCYGVEMKDVLVSCKALDRNGVLHTFYPDAAIDSTPLRSKAGDGDGIKKMHMTYRHNDAPEDLIFISAILKGKKDNANNVLENMAQIKLKRETSQPIREKTGGSTFANPSIDDLVKAGLPETTKVWELIDKVGGRGLKIGGAMMSEKHCNFMINSGGATASDLESLGEELIKRVDEAFGITLRWEIKRVGNKK